MTASPYLLIGLPLLLITVYCFGFVLLHRHTSAQLGPSANPKPAPSALQPPGGLTIMKPSLTTLSPGGAPTSDPEDMITPQFPGVAGTQIQQAEQRRQAAPNSDNASSEALLKKFNSAIRSSEH